MTRTIFVLLASAVPAVCGAAVLASDQSPAPKVAASDAAAAHRALMIVRNSDGTMTVQMTPSQSAAKEGLVIPPQIVVPFIQRR